VTVVGSGGDTTTIGAGICGDTNGCIGVYTPSDDLQYRLRAIFGSTSYYND